MAEFRACNNNTSFYKVLESCQYFDDTPVYPYKEFVELSSVLENEESMDENTNDSDESTGSENYVKFV